MAMTKAQMEVKMNDMTAELTSLKTERDALSREVHGGGLPTLKVNGVKVILRGHGLDGLNLFSQALDGGLFVTYGAVAEAIGVLKSGESFRNTEHLPPVKEFIVETEVGHLVVNKQGRYGRKAPVSQHYAALNAIGYDDTPKKTEPKTKKVEKVDKKEAIAALLALLAD